MTDLDALIKRAMIDQDHDARDSLRLVKAEAQRKAKEDKRDVTPRDIDDAIRKISSELSETLEASEALANDAVRTCTLKHKIAALTALLPAQMSGDVLRERIQEIIDENRIENMSGMKIIMSVLDAETDGNFDRGAAGKIGAELIKQAG